MITQKIKVNIIPDGVAPELHCSRNDNLSRTFLLDLYAGDELFTIPLGATVFFQGTTKDGTTFQKTCDFSGNEVTAEITSEMTGSSGRAVAELAILADQELIHSQNIMLKVEGL